MHQLDPVEKLSLTDHLTHFWLTKQKLILSSLVALVIISGFSLYFSGKQQKKSAQVLFKAHMIEKELMQASSDQISPQLHSLKEILAKTPELKSLYEPLLHQGFLLKGEPLALSSHASVEPYHTFTDISLLITQGQLAQAAEKSSSLAQSLEKERDVYPYLTSLNAIRQAFLYQSLKSAELEKKQWETVLGLLETSGANQPLETQKAIAFLEHQFSQGSISISTYAKNRILTLSKQN